MVLSTVKLKHRNSTISLSTRRRGVAKELTARKNITKEFTIVFYEIQFIVIRNSKLAGSSKSPSKWMLAQEDHPCCPSSEEFERYRKNGSFSRWRRCDFDQTFEPQSQSRTVSTENQPKNVQNSFSSVSKMAPFFKVFLVELERPEAAGAHEFNSFFFLDLLQ